MPTLRLATAADEPALLALTRATPMMGDIALTIEREPEFAALTRARGRGRTVVAEVGGEVVGCVSASRRRAWLAGEPGEMGVIADLKVHPEHRRGGLAQALLDEIARYEADEPPAVYVGLTAAGNDPVDAAVRRFGAGRPLIPLGDLVSLQLLPLWSPRARTDARLAEEEPSDEVIALFDSVGRGLSFAPVLSDGGWAELAARSPGMGRPRVARVEGRAVAALLAWDTDAVKRTRVLSLPPALRLFAGGVRIASAVLPLPRLPWPGEPLHFRTVRFFAHLPGHAEALVDLLRAEVAHARAAGEHFVLFTTAADDPLGEKVGRLPHSTYRYRLTAGVNREEALPLLDALRGRPLYDDAAVA